MEQIQFVGLNELEKVDQVMIQTLATEYYRKIQRLLHNETCLKIHIKPYKKEGARHKYSVHAKAIAPTRHFESESSDWDLSAAMHGCCKDLKKQLEHEFKA